MAYSKWLKMDLHIHSDASGKTKANDYDGDKLTCENLIAALQREEVNLFSITDHNTINTELYNDLIRQREDLISKGINFLIGAEIDFYDTDIHSETFHMLVFFNTEDIKNPCNVLTKIFNVNSIEDIDKNIKPVDLQSFFKTTFEEGISDIITIPHFNNKEKGISGKDIDKLVFTVFNALEDSNNRQKLVKSIKFYKEHDYADVPVVVFSDNHDIGVYPEGKNKNTATNTFMYILGNVEHPFSSVKSAFQDIEMRTYIENVTSRDISENKDYIKALKFDDVTVELSEFQNTIIGGFGTGKSFLLDMILNGKSNVNVEKYQNLANNYNEFTLIFSDGTNRSSLMELEDKIKIIQFNQYKDIYFSDILLEKDKELLEKNLQILFPCLEATPSPSTEELAAKFKKYENQNDKMRNISDNISYEAISKKHEKAYSFELEDVSGIFCQEDYIEGLKLNLEKEAAKEIFSKKIYSGDELNNINRTKDIIENKNEKLTGISKSIDEVIGAIDEEITAVNKKGEELNKKTTSNVKIINDIKENLLEYISTLFDLKNECEGFQTHFEEKKLEELRRMQIRKVFFDFEVVAQYKTEESFGSFENIFKSDYRRATLFESIIATIYKRESFAKNKPFEEQVKKFADKVYSNFSTVCYDIYADGISIMKRSAGEKANIIINIIFRIVEDYSKKGIASVVLLDQPEDNLDNKGITQEVVDKIRGLKINNLLPQIICVTHNPNISITADSENILLARKEGNKCVYKASGIEDVDFIEEVCKIVEGGAEALRKRGIKFNIPIIKELERIEYE